MNTYNMDLSKNIYIESKGFKASESLRLHIHKNAERLFRHEPSIERLDVFLARKVYGTTNEEFRCTIKLAVAGPDIVVTENGDALEQLITQTSHICDRQLRKRSRKINASVKSTRIEDLQVTI